MQINEFKKTKAMKTESVQGTVKIYAEGVSGVVVEVARYAGIGLNEATFRVKEAFDNYDNPQIEIY